MFLAYAWNHHRTQVRADLQRYYRLNIERMGTDFSIWQAAACAAALPLGSTLMQAIEPKAMYTLSDFLMHRIGDILCGKHIPYPWEENETEKPVADFGKMDIDDFKAWHAERFENEPVSKPYEGG